MLNFLNNNEMEQLHKILINTLKDFTFIKDDKKSNSDLNEPDYCEMFVMQRGWRVVLKSL